MQSHVTVDVAVCVHVLMACHYCSSPAAETLSSREALKVLKMAATYDHRQAGRCQAVVQEDARVWGKFQRLACRLTSDGAVELFRHVTQYRWVTTAGGLLRLCSCQAQSLITDAVQ
jgi:hypothetical protein